jgi:hypothetical protein
MTCRLGREVRTAAVLLLGAAIGSVAQAQDRPATIPTRDVDLVYRMVQPDAPGGPRALVQRMRWAVKAGKLRVDPPTAGFYMIMDYKTHRLETVRDGERMVMEMDASGAGLSLGAPSAAAFVRGDTAVVAGLNCTNWETTDAAGEPTRACMTADGVLLRAVAAGRVLVEAVSVRYGPIDASVFRIPDDYQRLKPPPPRASMPPGDQKARPNP